MTKTVRFGTETSSPFTHGMTSCTDSTNMANVCFDDKICRHCQKPYPVTNTTVDSFALPWLSVLLFSLGGQAVVVTFEEPVKDKFHLMTD